jgi:hypothetical protein
MPAFVGETTGFAIAFHGPCIYIQVPSRYNITSKSVTHGCKTPNLSPPSLIHNLISLKGEVIMQEVWPYGDEIYNKQFTGPMKAHERTKQAFTHGIDCGLDGWTRVMS